MAEDHVKNQRYAGINLNVGAMQVFWHPFNGSAGYYRASRGIDYDASYRLMLHPEMSLDGLREARDCVERALESPGAKGRKDLLRRWLADSKAIEKTLPPAILIPWDKIDDEKAKADAETRRLASQVDAKKYGGLGMKTKRAKKWRKQNL